MTSAPHLKVVILIFLDMIYCLYNWLLFTNVTSWGTFGLLMLKEISLDLVLLIVRFMPAVFNWEW